MLGKFSMHYLVIGNKIAESTVRIIKGSDFRISKVIVLKKQLYSAFDVFIMSDSELSTRGSYLSSDALSWDEVHFYKNKELSQSANIFVRI